MKTSMSNLFAVAGLACILSASALAASPVTPADGQTPSIPHTETAPGGSALPPGSPLPTDPAMGNGGDAKGSRVQQRTPIIDEQEAKDHDARQKALREQDRDTESREPHSTKP